MVRKTFKLLFSNFKMFLGLWFLGFLALALISLTVGTEKWVSAAFAGIVSMILWLVSIYLARQILAKKKVSLADGLFNGLAPLLSVFVIGLVAAVQVLPIVVLLVAYAAAVETNFLATFGYAVLFLIFAVGMILISGFLLPSTIVSMVAVSAPGLYPVAALRTTRELMKGRRWRFWGKMLVGMLVMALIGVIVLAPLIGINAAVGWEVPVVTIGAMAVESFVEIFFAVYLYIYYKNVIK